MVHRLGPDELAAMVNLHEFEAHARACMSGPAFDYVAGGSWDEITLAENDASWREFRFVPRVLTDIRSVDVSGSFLGRPSALPIGIAPMAAQAMAHPDAEGAMARAAAAAGIPMILSTSASMTPEAVAAAAPGADRMFQLYLLRDLGYIRSVVERAAASGYRAIVLTVDLPALGYRERDRRNGFALPRMPLVESAGGAARGRYGGLDDQRALGLTWADLAQVRTWSELPLVLKGILAPEDARLAVEHGVDAIVVSNHGGRQLDRSIATAHALQDVVAAVHGRAEVWVDGGIRRGLDVAIALALGADGVLVGRPLYWALAAGGQAGVERAIAILREEFDLALPLLGCASVADLGPTLVRRRGEAPG
ncbi:MAG TPA: alpha-hydroxy acid oxidase [Candidatus Sulfomarinibacteraceae bacterium]|nr:alpha-hydroxy acid oxidase [Candidatus Sulfomarinibacteraceae bacterium]